MPNSAHLSEEDMRRIEAEELAALKAVQERETEARRRMAAHAYREEVRIALRPRPFWWPVRWALPFIPVVALALFLTLRPASIPEQDNLWGGISDAELMHRCTAQVSVQLAAQTNQLIFPSLRDSAGQFTASPEGKRWDGWTQRRQSGTPPLDFSCTYTTVTDGIQVELIQEAEP